MNGNSWPEGVTSSLWDIPVVAETAAGRLPLMGIDFQSGFLWAFLFGCALVFAVGWRNLRTGEAYAVSSNYTVINDLKIGDLGGGNVLTRACLLYAGTLSVVYIALTFFGKLLLEILNTVPEVGVQVDTTKFRFDSPQWPLTIAFGFAGIAPMLKPVQIVEGWLRRRTYRAVGIPVRIEQSTRKILEILRRQSVLAEEGKAAAAGAPQDQDPPATSGATCPMLVARLGESQREFEAKLKDTWIEAALKMREGRFRQVLRTYAELDLLIDWANGLRGAWPGAEVPESLRQRERDLVKDCEERLDDILLRINEYTNPAEQPAASPGATAADPAANKLHRLNWLKKVIGEMEIDRDNLVAVLSIYAEKDPDIGLGESMDGQDGRRHRTGGAIADDQLNEPMLNWLLNRALREAAGKGPDAEVFAMLPLAFLIYGICMAKGWHEITAPGADQSQPVVVLFSAGVETLRLAALVSFPVLVAFALRQNRQDAGQWIGGFGHQGQIYLRHLWQAAGLVAIVAFVGLVGFSTMYAFVNSKDETHFDKLMTSMDLPIVGYYVALTPIAVVIAISGLIGADLRRHRQRGAIVLGLAAAMLVLTWQYLHLRFFYGTAFFCPWGSVSLDEGANSLPAIRLTDLRGQLADLRAQECFRHYGGLDLMLYPLLAFLVTAVFGQPVPAHYRHRDPGHAPPAPRRPGWKRSLAALLGGLVWLASVQPALSEGLPRLIVGFREDAVPFSYRSAWDKENDEASRPFRGYLADLCYEAFEGTYDIVPRPVTLQDRFQRLNPADPERIDVLCDPVTLRLGARDGRTDALFSPVVFVSGVTYLRPPGNPDSVQITYGANSTAAGLAPKLCRNDVLRVVRREQRRSLPQFCDTAEALLFFASSDPGMRAPVSCRVAGKDARTDCLEWAVQAESRLARGDLSRRGRAGHMPRRLREDLERRVNAWASIEENLARQRMRPDDMELRNGIIKDLGGDCRASVSTAQGIIAPYRFCPQESHREMIKWFCDPLAGRSRVYLGDREIILANHRSYQELVQDCGAPVSGPPVSGPDLSYEPYVILVRKDCVGVFMHLQKRVYELFSDRHWARENYERAFGDSVMSQPLAYMFLLNGVEPEGKFINADPLKPGPTPASPPGPSLPASAPDCPR